MELPADFRDLLVCLYDAGAEIAIVGGYAVAFHGHPRATKDLNVLIRPTRDNARKVYRGLAAFGAPLESFQVSDADFASYDGVLQLGVAPLRIDIINRIAVPFDQVISDGDIIEVEGRPIPIIGRGALVEAKLRAGRPQDLADVAALRQGQRTR